MFTFKSLYFSKSRSREILFVLEFDAKFLCCSRSKFGFIGIPRNSFPWWYLSFNRKWLTNFRDIVFELWMILQHVNIAANVNMAFSASISPIPHPTPKKEQKDVVSVFVESD